MNHEPSHYVQPDVSETRINRLWLGVSERLEQRPARAWRWLALCTALAGAAGGAWFIGKGALSPGAAPQAVLAGASLQTAAASRSVTLLDGSRLALAARTELTVRGNEPAAVLLALGRGQVDFDVAPRPGRSFSVLAGDVEVRVVGTKFSIKATPEPEGLRVEVSVLYGMVEIQSARRPGIVARVAAGQSWLQLPGPHASAGAAVLEPSQPSAPALSPEALAKSDAAPPAPSGAAAGPSARELFEKAGERRRAGDAAGAARAYEELLRAYPADGRASLSAFELGRLRMDRLGDSAGAIAALERAVGLNVGPTFREDALARLVSVYASQGNFAACARARDRYLASYPAGVHSGAVGTRCGAR